MNKNAHGVHRSNIRFRFQFPSFDFVTQWFMGAQTHSSAESGEILYATSRISDADPISWNQEWSALAQRVEKRAKESLQRGHRISARQGYFRAYTYYRAPLVYLNPYDSQNYEAIYEKAKACLQIAASLCDPAIEPVAIPFDGRSLPGYFAKASSATTPSPTLIMIGGGDTYVEDLYGYIVPAAHLRGYNVLLVDLPGQGILPNRGLPMRPDAEIPMSAVIDYALSRPEVDRERLAAYGISGGGYLVPRATGKYCANR
jgi:Esterase FrsA-like